MQPRLKYWIFLLAIVNLIFGVIMAGVLGAWFNLAPDERAFVHSLADKILPFPVLGAFILVGAIGGLVSLLFKYYIIPTLQLAEETRLITKANAEHRITPRGARELVYLTEVINDSAEAYARLKTEVEEQIRAAHAELDEERNRLAALMSELPAGVLVCNSDGQILLYNAQAQKLLQGARGLADDQPQGLIGLGRSVFGLLDREPIVHGLKLLQAAREKNRELPTSHFMTTLADGRCLRIAMAPVLGSRRERREISGFVLTLEDMSVQIEADTRRDMLIQALTEGIQDALEDIRRSITTILADPQLGPEQLEKNRATIDRASRELQVQLAEARRNYARHLQALSKVENVLAENLVQILRKNIDERFGIRVEGEAAPGLVLRLDSYSLVQAVSHLAALLKKQQNMGAFQIRIAPAAPQRALMSIGWPQACLDHGFISDWVRAPLITDAQGKLLSFSELVARHGGEVQIEATEAHACHEVRIDLPVESTAEHPEQSLPESRPVYYEFDLFQQRGLEELGDQPLRKLTYVVFDTETTGLRPAEGDEIIQIGAVRVVNGRILTGETVDQLIDPCRSVPPESVEIHGIRPELLVGQPTIEQVLPHFHRFAEGAVLVAHNAAFDMRFLQLKERQSGVRFDNPVLDTLLLSSVVHPHQQGHSLDHIAKLLNLTIVGRHTALGDALVTAEVLLKLIPLLESQGIHTLKQALDASINSPFAKMAF
ncbi:exonuclease domain-containing protein [Geoalkalibacter halelectricus]|uniref:3'-5' exonuclease n=1 Tax=Geoalkalibacter halelectricus TaxID=2847045 RepID=UPI003D1992AC